MKIAWLIISSILVCPLQAQDKIICSMLRVSKIVKEVNSQVKFDKVKHCAVSCSLTLYCPAREVEIVGHLKEFLDLMGAGNADPEDIKANRVGIDFAISGSCKTESECLSACKDYDWRIDF